MPDFSLGGQSIIPAFVCRQSFRVIDVAAAFHFMAFVVVGAVVSSEDKTKRFRIGGGHRNSDKFFGARRRKGSSRDASRKISCGSA